MLSGEGCRTSKTTRMLAQKQPPLKECVIAHWSRGPAPKISGAQAQNRSRGRVYISTERLRRRKNRYLQGNRERRSSATSNGVDTAESDFNKPFERCADVYTLGRGAFLSGRRQTGRTAGRVRSENAGMSSETTGENPVHRKPKESRATLVVPG